MFLMGLLHHKFSKYALKTGPNLNKTQTVELGEQTEDNLSGPVAL